MNTDLNAAVPTMEVELKYAVTDLGELEALAGGDAFGDAMRLGAPRWSREVDWYLDTPDRAFTRAGYALRVRDGDGWRKVALKSLDAEHDGPVHSRFELEGSGDPSVPPTDPNGWPDTVRHLAVAIGGRWTELKPLCRLQQDRLRRDVHRTVEDGDQPRVAELSLDQVQVFGPDSNGELRTATHWPDRQEGAESGGAEATTPVGQSVPGHDGPDPLATFYEVECELVADGSLDAEGARRVLDGAREALKAAGQLSSIKTAKLQRALELVAESTGDGRLGIQPDLPMTEAARMIWRRQLVQILLTEAGARLGEDIEYVHDMRVATRRSRSAFRVFGGFFKSKATRDHIAGLKMTARRLGAVRDLDVALDNLSKHRARLDGEERDALQPLEDHWRSRRVLAYEKLLAWLDGQAYRDFLRGFTAFTHESGAGARDFSVEPGESPRPHRVADVFPAAIQQSFSRVRAYEPLLAASDVPVETLHALRIDCKRLRYSIEPVQHLMGEPGRGLVKQLKALQDHLGDLNDAAVAAETLEAAAREGVDSEALRHYIGRQHDIIESLRRDFHKVWDPFIGRENRERLGHALAQL